MSGFFFNVPNFDALKNHFVSGIRMELLKCDRYKLTAEYAIFALVEDTKEFQWCISVEYKDVDGFKSGIFSGSR